MKNRNRIKKIIIFIIIAILFGLGQSGARKQENAKTINSNKNTVEIIKNTETTQTISETENLYENSTEENLSIDLTEVNTEEMGYYDIPKYVGEPYVEINNNLPYFSDEEYSKKSYEYYSSLDQHGRAGEAIACMSFLYYNYSNSKHSKTIETAGESIPAVFLLQKSFSIFYFSSHLTY